MTRILASALAFAAGFSITVAVIHLAAPQPADPAPRLAPTEALPWIRPDASPFLA